MSRTAISTSVRRARDAAGLALLRTTLVASPGPSAAVLRRAFAADGARVAAVLDRHAPAGIARIGDVQYGGGPDEVLDLYRPDDADGPLPAVIWIHGGGYIGGSKAQLSGYFRILAAQGYVVVAPDYSLAPAHTYPEPVRQLVDVLAFIARDADRLGIDAQRLAVCGDSAGAQLAAQLAALSTTPGYADASGLTPPPASIGMRAVVLACGPYEIALADGTASAAERWFLETVLRAYSGRRGFRVDPAFAAVSVAEHVSGDFPPTLITVGNADPLRRHSAVLAARLAAAGVPTVSLVYDEDHEPPLGHEYQFELDTSDAQGFLARTIAFLSDHLSDDNSPPPLGGTARDVSQ